MNDNDARELNLRRTFDEYMIEPLTLVEFGRMVQALIEDTSKRLGIPQRQVTGYANDIAKGQDPREARPEDVEPAEYWLSGVHYQEGTDLWPEKS